MIRRVRSRRPLEAGKFDYKYIGVKVGDIPLVGTGKPDHEVFALHLDEFIYSRYLRFARLTLRPRSISVRPSRRGVRAENALTRAPSLRQR